MDMVKTDSCKNRPDGLHILNRKDKFTMLIFQSLLIWVYKTLNPLEVKAGMRPVELKERYGKDPGLYDKLVLCFGMI